MVGQRGKNFSQVELDRILDLTEEHLPRGAQEWEEVARLYNDGNRAEFNRYSETLRNKYNRMRGAEEPEKERGAVRAILIQKK